MNFETVFPCHKYTPKKSNVILALISRTDHTSQGQYLLEHFSKNLFQKFFNRTFQDFSPQKVRIGMSFSDM